MSILAYDFLLEFPKWIVLRSMVGSVTITPF